MITGNTQNGWQVIDKLLGRAEIIDTINRVGGELVTTVTTKQIPRKMEMKDYDKQFGERVMSINVKVATRRG